MNLPCSVRSGVGLAVAVAILGAASAGCSTDQAEVASAQPRPSAAPHTGRAASPAATPPASAALPPAPCRTSGLSVAPGGQSDRDGLNVAKFVLTDTGPGPCTLDGSPLITPQGPLDGQSTMEANLAVSQQDLSLPPDAKESDGITLRPGRSADFDLGWYSESSVVCETSDGFGFDPPGDTGPADAAPVSFPFGSMCDGLFYVSPVYSTS